MAVLPAAAEAQEITIAPSNLCGPGQQLTPEDISRAIAAMRIVRASGEFQPGSNSSLLAEVLPEGTSLVLLDPRPIAAGRITDISITSPRGMREIAVITDSRGVFLDIAQILNTEDQQQSVSGFYTNHCQ